MCTRCVQATPEPGLQGGGLGRAASKTAHLPQPICHVVVLASFLCGPQGCEMPRREGPGAYKRERRAQGTRVALAPGKDTEGELVPAPALIAECAVHVLGEGAFHLRLRERADGKARNPRSDSGPCSGPLFPSPHHTPEAQAAQTPVSCLSSLFDRLTGS